jgi:hypothetical protein
MKIKISGHNAGSTWAAAGMVLLASMATAMYAHGQSAATSAANQTASPAPTPRTADGHPDLTGSWAGGFGFPGLGAPPPGAPAAGGRGAGGFGFKVEISPDGKQRALLGSAPDGDITKAFIRLPADRRKNDTNRPEYKPEFVAKVIELDDNSNKTDPTTFNCLPPGVPRIGAPSQILQTPGWVVLFYGDNRHRVIPTDGRPHLDVDTSYLGDSVGHWEGDTLVVDVTRLSDDTWFGPGYFHTEDMHVVEHFTREGDSLKYEVTVEDPNVLVKPWIMTPRTLKFGGAFHQIAEDPACIDRDQAHFVNNYQN